MKKANMIKTAFAANFMGTLLQKKEDRLIASAKLHFKSGDVKKFCEIMMDLG
jgi:hypothetical protein